MICGLLGVPEILTGGPWGANYFHKIGDTTSPFHCVDSGSDVATLMVPQQESRQWYQVNLVVIVFFTAIEAHLKKESISRKNEDRSSFLFYVMMYT